MLFNALGVYALHVPSKSGASAVADLVAGNVQLIPAPRRHSRP